MRHLLVVLLFAIMLAPQLVQAQQPEISIKEWVIPASNSAPHDIVVDNNGIAWFTEINANKIGRFDPKTEEFTEYDIPTPSSRPHGLVIDQAGNIWFTENSGHKIGKLNPATKKVDEFPTPTPNSAPHTPILGAGVLWFTEISASKIGRLDISTGKIDEFPTPTRSSSPYGIVVDVEGNAWFAELTGHKIGKVNAKTGEITEYATPTRDSGTRRIAIDSKGKLWFTEYNSGKIGSFDPKTNEMKEYETSSPTSGPYAIWVDIFDNVWYSMTNSYKVGRIEVRRGGFDVEVILSDIDLPTPRTIIRFIYADHEGKVWFPNNSNNKIGVITSTQKPQERVDVPKAEEARQPVKMPEIVIEERVAIDSPKDSPKVEIAREGQQPLLPVILLVIGIVAVMVGILYSRRKSSA